MAVKPVLQLGARSLWEPSGPVSDPVSAGVSELAADLHDTLLHWRRTTGYGRAIAAPQIGAQVRVVVADLGERWVLVNPKIEARSPRLITFWDACLCFLDLFFTVERHEWVDVTAVTERGEPISLRADGELSELLQHEIDHLDGILALERMSDVRSMCTREHFERHHRADSPYRAGATP